MSELSQRLRDRAGPVQGENDDLREIANEIERLEHNQITTDSTTLAQAAALQAQRADEVEREARRKSEMFTKVLLSAMGLIDELLRENSRLCAASNEPPSVRLFAAKNSFDIEMKKLLGEREESVSESDDAYPSNTETKQ